MSGDLTERQLHILRHAIGIGRDRTLTGKPWRNHYASPLEGEVAEAWEDLVDRGFAERGELVVGGHLRYYRASEAGIAAARADEQRRRDAAGLRQWVTSVWFDGEWHDEVIVATSRGRARYQRILELQDAWDIPFRRGLEIVRVRVAEDRRRRKVVADAA